MPCGGIYPIKESWLEPYLDNLSEDICYYCNLVIIRPVYYCEEWDCFLHKDCIAPFLNTEDGKLVIEHGHEIVL